jgi:phage-related protein
VTSEEVFEMAKAGEIDLATFRKAVEKNIGGAAKEMGWKTINGAIDNTMAALARVGAALFGVDVGKGDSFAEIIIPRLRRFVDFLDNDVTPKVEKFGNDTRKVFLGVEKVLGQFSPAQLLGGFGAIVALGPALTTVGNIILHWGAISTVFTTIGTGVTTALTSIGAVAAGVLPAIGTAFTLLLHPISAIQLLIAGMPTLFAGIGTAITGALGSIVAALTSPLVIGAALVALVTTMFIASQPLRKALADIGSALLPPIIAAVKALIPVGMALVTEFISIAQTLGNSLAPVIRQLQPVLVTVVGIISNFATAVAPWLIGVISTIGAVIKALIVIVAGVVSTIITLIGRVVKTITNLPKSITKIWNNIKKTAIRVWTSIVVSVISKIAALKTRIDNTVDRIREVMTFKNLKEKVSNVFDSVKNAITKPFKSAWDTLSGIVSRIKGLFPINIGSAIKTLRIPQLHVSGGKAPWGLGGKGSMPSITWAAKGGIVDGATLIGAGEAGKEAIVPLDPFWKKMEEMDVGNKTTYNIEVNVDAQDLEGVMDVKDFLIMLQRAKAFV